MQDEDDDGFYGYVETTVDPGSIILIITIAVSCFFLITLPVAVIIGDRGEERRKRKRKNNGTEETGDGELRVSSDYNDDEASVSSKSTYYSAIAGVLNDALDQTGKPTRSRGHRRHRHRRKATLDNAEAEEEQEKETGSSKGRHPEKRPYSENSEKQSDPMSSKKTAESRSEHLNKRKNRQESIPANLDEKLQEEWPPTSDLGGSSTGTLTKGDKDNAGNKNKSNNNCMSVSGFLDEIAAIMAWDVEMKRIIKLSIPFATQAIFTGALDILTVGVIGKLIGTREVSAFVVVNMLVELSTEFTGGFLESLATLCSQAIGNKNNLLAGKYVQIATILYCVSSLPFMALWVLYVDVVMDWLGFDAETVLIGQKYTYILVVDYWIEGFSDSIHGLLDVAGFENYSTLMGVTEEALAFCVVLGWALLGNPDLMSVAYVQFSMGILFIFLNGGIIWCKGWFKPYRKGIVGTFALKDGKAVLLVMKTSLSLSFGYLLTDGEWELMTIFASFLGPAEVTAWGIYGSIWDGVNELIDGIADASEVRCAYLLGAGLPERARLSAFKSLVICVFTALFLTSLIFMAGEDLPTWLTNDPTLQHILKDLLPMFGLGNAAMALGTVAWTILGAQGRYRLATVIVGLVSWFVTLPLGAFFSIYLKINLQGQTSAVVIGYMLAGSIHAYFLFRSDWAALSKQVMEDNESREVKQIVKPEVNGT